MPDTVATTLVRLALIPAFAITPLLLIRNFAPRLPALLTLALASATILLLNSSLPLFLHAFSIPITPIMLATAHFGLAAILSTSLACRRLPIIPHPVSMPLMLPLACFSFAILVVPITHLAGIDTYKWQDLATNVAIEQRIPWLTHPLALFGYVSPRSYPCIQPLVLASAEMLGGFGIEWGFYLVSLASGFTGIWAMYWLAREFSGDDRGAAWAAWLYALSPVFMRYNHWATGRGVFMALLPFFILALLKLPNARAFLAALLMSALLLAAHRVGVVLIILGPPLLALALCIKKWSRFASALTLLGAGTALTLAACLVPPVGMPPPFGSLVGLLFHATVRFAILVPLAVAGFILASRRLSEWNWALALAGCIATIPVAFTNMYGALLALPFIAILAGHGLEWLWRSMPRFSRPISILILLATWLVAEAVVGYRGANATPPHVYAAAIFLQAQDPFGPFQVSGPGRTRGQVQAYVTGCPRFPIHGDTPDKIRWAHPPELTGSLKHRAQLVETWLRHVLIADETPFQWYGNVRSHYYFIVNGKGEKPPNVDPFYNKDGVEIYAVPVNPPVKAGIP